MNDTQYMSEMRAKLNKMGFSDENIQASTGEIPELTVKSSTELDTGYLLDNLLDGNNPLIISIVIPAQRQGAAKEEYIKKAENALDKLELFESPRLLRMSENQALFSIKLSQDSAEKLAEDNIESVMEALENRINKFGVAESTIPPRSRQTRILIEIPEEQKPQERWRQSKSWRSGV